MVDKVTSWASTRVLSKTFESYGGCGPDTFSTGGAGIYPEGGTRTVPGSAHGDWRARMSRHQCVTTSLVANEDVFHYEPGESFVMRSDLQCTPNKPNAVTRHYGHVFRLNATTDVQGDPSGLSATVALNRAKQAYQKDFLRKRNRLQSLVNVNERAEMVRMVQGAGSLLRRNVLDYIWDVTKRTQKVWKRGQTRHQRRRPVREALTVASDAWLQFQFGIRPLIGDLDTAANILNGPRHRNLYNEVYGKGEEVVSLYRYSRSSNSGTHDLKWDVLKETKVTVVLQGKVNVGTKYNGTMNKLGLTLSDFVPTVYECIPYSFLVDYFLNLGDVIEGYCMNWSGLLWSQFVAVREITSWVDPSTCRNEFPADAHTKAIFTSPGASGWNRKYVNRQQYQGSLQPSLEWRLPGVGSTKWCNVAALFGSANANYRKAMSGTLAGVRL